MYEKIHVRLNFHFMLKSLAVYHFSTEENLYKPVKEIWRKRGCYEFVIAAKLR